MPATVSPIAVRLAKSGTFVSTVPSTNALYDAIGFSAICFATIFGIVSIQRSDANGSGKNAAEQGAAW